MDTFRNRITMALIGFIVFGAITVVLSFMRTEEMRSAVHLQATDQAQIQSYFELHANLRGFYSEYARILDDVNRASDLDVAAYRRRVDELLLSLRAQIEREDIELGGGEPAYLADGNDETSERAKLLSLANEIRSMFAGSEIAAALFRAGRSAEGRKVLEEALDQSVDKKLDAIIDEAVAANKAQARASEEAIFARLSAVKDRLNVFLVAFVTFLAAAILLVGVPFVRSMAFLQGQADKLALGGDVDPAPNKQCREFADMHEGLRHVAAAHKQLRDERDASEAEFNERTDAMRQIDQVRRDFLADVSHELRTPLTVLRGVAEVALRTQSNDPTELKTALAHIVDESRHVARIVDDLFFIARSQAGALDLRTDVVDLAAVSKAAEREAVGLAQRRRGRVAWHGLPEPVEVEGDEDRLRQLFTILVDNALKYGGRNPAVEVDHRLIDKVIIIYVRDHGPGVPEEDLPHVFERLYRGAAPVTAEPNGSGLGLPLAKSIVEGHGGEISLENAEGGGALARVSLPIFDANALEVTPS